MSGQPTNYQLLAVFTLCIGAIGFAAACIWWRFA